MKPSDQQAILDALPLYVVYDHPRDFPKHIVVREQHAQPNGQIVASAEAFLYDTVEAMHAEWSHRGLFWYPRFENDDPCILGVWL